MEGMCYPPPGPRCSAHAHKAYNTAVRAFEAETEPARKLALSHKMEETRDVFDTTPRGQHWLTNDIVDAQKNADLAGEERIAVLRLRYRKAVSTRNNQLDAYYATKDKQKENLSRPKDLYQTGNKQSIAAHLVAHAATSQLYVETHFEDMYNVMIDDMYQQENRSNVLPIPEKQQRVYGDTDHIPERVVRIAQQHPHTVFNYENGSPERTEIDEWLHQTHHTKFAVDSFASCDTKTGSVQTYDIQDLMQHYDVMLKLKPKRGGTNPWVNEYERLLKLLKGTPYGEGRLIRNIVTDDGVTIKGSFLLDVPYVPHDERKVEGVHLSEKQVGGLTYYEVRKPHNGDRMNLFVVLKRQETALLNTNLQTLKNRFQTRFH